MANISELKQFGYKQRTVYKTTKQRNSDGSIITIDTPVGYTYHKTYEYDSGWCTRKVSVKEVSGIWKVTYTFDCIDGPETFELESPPSVEDLQILLQDATSEHHTIKEL